MTLPSLRAVVLAAGKGTRLHSNSPKVLRSLLGEPMLYYVYQALEPAFGAAIHTIVGFGREEVARTFPDMADRFIVQEQQLGTGHALRTAWEAMAHDPPRWLVVANGDTPLLQPRHLDRLLQRRDAGPALAFLTITPEEPAGLGRVVRSEGGGLAIVEAKDLEPSLHGDPKEVNAGIYLFDMERVAPLLGELSNQNKSGEYYVTDLVALAGERGMSVEAVNCGEDPGLLGVNTAPELCEAEERLRSGIVRHWLETGVVIRQAGSARIGPRARIDPGVELCGPVEVYGRSCLGEGVRVDSHVVLQDAELAGCRVKSFSHVEGAFVEPGAAVGPYARLRPGAVLRRGARVGNFVEMKKAELGEGSKASHLSYLGDATVGPAVNIGAGTITCNYDGVRKHHTHIESGAFIGSNTALVAPVRVGSDSLVAAGSTITEDVPAGNWAFGRARQKNISRSDGSP
jgi:bifunctional UDP-N-acetylglucosamine pyrophosphorylase/glucosamine-1-phosphate N-acetyltransferase